MSKQTYLTLNNGVKIPQFGIGVFLIDGEDNTEKAVLEALKMGYRHIDTAHAYFNEKGVGAAVRKSGIPRNEIFLLLLNYGLLNMEKDSPTSKSKKCLKD